VTNTDTHTALWDGRLIEYRPGVLRAVVRPGYNRPAFAAIHDAGGVVACVNPEGCRVEVAPRDTLRVASELFKTGWFVVVEPAVEESFFQEKELAG
jgi:hypothetical protein